MRYLSLPVLAIAAALSLTGVAGAAEKTVILNVDNMFCATCGPTVKKSLARIAGVKKADVSIARQTATVTFDDAVVDVAVLIGATTNAGYPSRLGN